ncbi:hypothetical protein BMS3Abin08_01113 [bacterium BMS3Abin08]|nr:hypothetical protein BMS3Abin08_01113 [bacterium BMS3Abin08]
MSNSCRFFVIPACPESFYKKDSLLPTAFGIAGMTNDRSLYTDSKGVEKFSVTMPGEADSPDQVL